MLQSQSAELGIHLEAGLPRPARRMVEEVRHLLLHVKTRVHCHNHLTSRTTAWDELKVSIPAATGIVMSFGVAT